MKSFLVFLMMLISTKVFAQKLSCEPLKSNDIYLSNRVELSLDEPLVTTIKEFADDDGTMITKKEEFITNAFISSWKIDRSCKNPCTCTTTKTAEEFEMTAACAGVTVRFFVDLKKMHGIYSEQFEPRNISRNVPFKNCVLSDDDQLVQMKIK